MNMENKNKIYWYRTRHQDNTLRPWQKRTYQSKHNLWFLFGTSASLITLSFAHQKLFGASLPSLIHTWLAPDDLQALAVAQTKVSVMVALSILIGVWTAIKAVKPETKTKISEVSEHFYYPDTIEATRALHDVQKNGGDIIDFKNPPKNSWTLIRPEECKGKSDIYQPIQFNSNIAILGGFGIGLAGSGKSALFERIYQEILGNGHKMIVHAPDSKARDRIVSSGYSCVVSAPWLKSSVYIDLASTLNVEDANLKNELIGLVITSFFGYVDQSASDSFFQNGAVYILTASLRKLCHLMPGNWTLETWKDELVSKQQIWQFKELVDIYYPEAGFTISEDAEKMTASIIASITKTLVSIGSLALYFKNCRRPFDLRKWCLDEDDKQCIILCSDTEYAEVSKINIALFVNLTIPFLLSSSRETVFKKNQKRIYQALDEFPSFARNIDLNSWIRIVNEGRKFGNTAFVLAQVIKQFVSCFTSKNPMQDAQKFIGSFHTQYIAQPSNEDEEFLNNIVGEVTYDDDEAQVSIGEDKKRTFSYVTKPRKEKIGFKTLQSDLGVVKDKKSNPIGVKVAVRLFGTKLTAPLFFPFVNEFAKTNRDKFRDRLVEKDGLEYVLVKNNPRPLFVTTHKIVLTREDENKIYLYNSLSAKAQIFDSLTKQGNLKQAQITISEIVNIKKELGVAMNELETKFDESIKDSVGELIQDTIGDSLKDQTLEAIDHTGTLSAINNGMEMLEAMLDTEPEDKGVSNVLIENSQGVKKLGLKKKNKEIEL
jgi:hypothetical protein